MPLMFASCKPQPNWIPIKPKLMFQICQKLKRGFCIKDSYLWPNTRDKCNLTGDILDFHLRTKIATERSGKLTLKLPFVTTTSLLTLSRSCKIALFAKPRRDTSKLTSACLGSLLKTMITDEPGKVRAYAYCCPETERLTSVPLLSGSSSVCRCARRLT